MLKTTYFLRSPVNQSRRLDADKERSWRSIPTRAEKSSGRTEHNGVNIKAIHYTNAARSAAPPPMVWTEVLSRGTDVVFWDRRQRRRQRLWRDAGATRRRCRPSESSPGIPRDLLSCCWVRHGLHQIIKSTIQRSPPPLALPPAPPQTSSRKKMSIFFLNAFGTSCKVCRYWSIAYWWHS